MRWLQDSAIRFLPGSAGEKVRTDLSCTLFLCEPADYSGGELMAEDTFGTQSIKLPAGDAVLYRAPACTGSSR